MATSSVQPVNIFVSYSHADDKYRLGLHEALAYLRRRNLIKEWYDAEITPGDEFEPEIVKQLSKADIIMLLLSPSYINSDYCWNKEREWANQHRQQRDVRVVGVIVRDVRLEGLGLTQHKLLPKDRKPIQSWGSQDEAWSNVCEGVEQIINDLRNPSQVDDAIEVPKTIVATATAAQAGTNAKTPARVLELNSITQFWEQRASAVQPGNIVSLQGTFSQFAPMLMGAPKAKARLHKIFRQAMERSQLLRKRKGHSLDACLSVSAGQMVWRPRDDQSAFIYSGFYNSIVRNSIPVLVSRPYYDSELVPLFQAYGQNTFEAQITGRVIELDNSPAKQYMTKHAKSFIPAQVADELCHQAYGILVDGHHTSVKRQGNARYLDGDIWIAVESDGTERFLTSFLDLSNPMECTNELDSLIKFAQDLPGHPRLIAQYDEDHSLNSGYALVGNKNRFLDSIWQFGFGT